MKNKIAIITGASSGFGRATAIKLASLGVHLCLGARRTQKLEDLKKEIQKDFAVDVFTSYLDVSDSVHTFVDQCIEKFSKIDILVNNAGLALGKETIEQAQFEDWSIMMNTNFMGVFRMTQKILPHFRKNGSGHIINIGSISGQQAYEGGAGYCGSKFALRAFTQSLRLETLGQNIRVSSVDPGLAETEFSKVRFKGNETSAKEVYKGMDPLTGADVAETVAFVAGLPPHVNIDEIIITPTAQGNAFKVHRKN